MQTTKQGTNAHIRKETCVTCKYNLVYERKGEKATSSEQRADGLRPGELPRLPSLPELVQEATREQGVRLEPLSHDLPDKQVRRLRTALQQTVRFWREIQRLCQSHSTDDQAWSQYFREWNAALCRDLQTRPAGAKRTSEAAELLGLSHQQLKSVLEIYNPGCFAKRVHLHDLESACAFDLALGTDLLSRRKQQEALKLMNDVRPGLIIVSPPCRMYSAAMQNLLKDYRAENPEAMKRYMANRKEAQVLLDFAAEACELAHKLNLSFVLEHPATASSWHTEVLKRLCRLDGVHRITMDQCSFNLRGEQGLHRKSTGILTNNRHIAERLEVRCTRDHTHEPIEGGKRSIRSQVYTPLN